MRVEHDVIEAIKRPLRLVRDTIRFRYRVSRTLRMRTRPCGPKLTVVFLIAYAETWNSFKAIYDKASVDPLIDVRIVAMPIILDGSIADINKAKIYFDELGIDALDAYDYGSGTWLNLESLKATHVFYTRPYNNEYPIGYRTQDVSRFAYTCFVPYGYLDVFEGHFDALYNWDFFGGLNYAFPGQASIINACNSKFRMAIDAGFLHISTAGYVRFEHVALDSASQRKPRTTILWTPRWALRNNQNLSTFFVFVDTLVAYVKNNESVELICRPHPLAFGNFVKEGAMTLQQVEEFKRFLASEVRLELDNRSDYLESFSRCDILVSDTSALIPEFLLTGKPVVYTGELEGVSPECAEAYSNIYAVGSRSELENALDGLIAGRDEKKVVRLASLKSIYNDGLRSPSGIILDELKKSLDAGGRVDGYQRS